MIQAIRQLVKKDMLITSRNPRLFILSIIIPVVFVLLYSLITQMSATIPVAVARNSYGPASDKLVEILSNMKSVDGKRFEIQTLDPQVASHKYKQGKVGGLVKIPENFDQKIDKGRVPKVKLFVHNINSDATKNYQLRLDNAVYLFQQEYTDINISEEYTHFSKDISIKLYVGVGLLMFGIIYSAIINTGNLLAREWEDRTAKMLMLTPEGFLPLLIGKGFTAFLQTMISTLLIIIVMALTINFPFLAIKPILMFYFCVLFLFGASLGALFGAVIKKTLPIVTLGATSSIFFYLVCGNESSLRGLAYGGVIEKLWKLATYIPVTQITERMRMTFLNQAPFFTSSNIKSILFILLISFIFSIAALYSLKKDYSQSIGQ